MLTFDKISAETADPGRSNFFFFFLPGLHKPESFRLWALILFSEVHQMKQTNTGPLRLIRIDLFLRIKRTICNVINRTKFHLDIQTSGNPCDVKIIFGWINREQLYQLWSVKEHTHLPRYPGWVLGSCTSGSRSCHLLIHPLAPDWTLEYYSARKHVLQVQKAASSYLFLGNSRIKP